MSMGAKFKKWLNEPGIRTLINSWNPLSAKIIESMGFGATQLSSMAMAANHGFMDIGMTTMTQVLDTVRETCNTVNIPVTVDADTGFGNALCVELLVKELCKAGAAGVMIEDQVHPKRCPMIREQRPVISMEEMCGKVRIARDTADKYDKDFIIRARTDAWGKEKAIKRSLAYLEAGADIIQTIWGTCVHINIATMKEYARRIPAPLAAPDFPAKKLEEIGFKIAVYSQDPLRGAILGMRNILKAIKKEPKPYPELCISLDEFIDFMGREEVMRKWKKYNIP